MQQQQPKGAIEQWKSSMNFLVFVFQCAAVSVEVFLHRRFGERYIGLQGVLAIVLMLFFSLFFPGHDLHPLVWFLGAYLAMCLCARIGVFYRRFKGEHYHSFYTGSPTIRHFFPGWKETTVKRFVEPFFVFAIGFALIDYNRPLGAYLIFAAIGLFFTVNLTCMHEHAQALDMHDAVIAQTQVADRVREMEDHS